MAELLHPRGSAGLKAAVDEIARRTADIVGYIGEWHSHPDGASCLPSRHDWTFLVWLAQHMSRDGMPGVMAILCEGDVVSWQMATITQDNNDE